MIKENIQQIFLKNNYKCEFIIIPEIKNIYFSIKDILLSSEYNISCKNVLNQTMSILKKKDIMKLDDFIKEKDKNIIYSSENINFENDLYISDENLFLFLLSLKKGNDFKKILFDDIFKEIKKFYIKK